MIKRTVNDVLADLDELFDLIMETPVMSADFDRMIRRRNELMIELDQAQHPVQFQVAIKTFKMPKQ